MNRFILNVINDNNVLAAIIASLILVIIVGVCGFFLYRKWFAHKKAIEDKLDEMEASSENKAGTTTKFINLEEMNATSDNQNNELKTKSAKPIENERVLSDNNSLLEKQEDNIKAV